MFRNFSEKGTPNYEIKRTPEVTLRSNHHLRPAPLISALGLHGGNVVNLTSIAKYLNNHGWNYSVFLKSYEGSENNTDDVEANVRSLIGGAVLLEELGPVQECEVLEEVTECLSFVGDQGAGVEPSVIKSSEFRQLLKELINEIGILSKRSAKIWKFRFKDGNPAYPVFWDFAYYFSNSSSSLVLVGSSSD